MSLKVVSNPLYNFRIMGNAIFPSRAVNCCERDMNDQVMGNKKGWNKCFLCSVVLVIQQPEPKLSLDFVMCWNYLFQERQSWEILLIWWCISVLLECLLPASEVQTSGHCKTESILFHLCCYIENC